MKVLKRLMEETTKNVNFRCTQEQLENMKANARKYTKGDLTKWLRAAAQDYCPKSEDLVEIKKDKA